MCRRFGTLCQFHKKIRRRGIIQNKEYDIQNTAEVLNKILCADVSEDCQFHKKIRRRGIIQNKEYDNQNRAEVLNKIFTIFAIFTKPFTYRL
jgi:hypothetical protein